MKIEAPYLHLINQRKRVTRKRVIFKRYSNNKTKRKKNPIIMRRMKTKMKTLHLIAVITTMTVTKKVKLKKITIRSQMRRKGALDHLLHQMRVEKMID